MTTYPNLDAEMARHKKTQIEMARYLGITPTTLSFKLSGKSVLTLRECVKIKKFLNSNESIDYLFQTDDRR